MRKIVATHKDKQNTVSNMRRARVNVLRDATWKTISQVVSREAYAVPNAVTRVRIASANNPAANNGIRTVK
jgi:hypothetical protein